MATEAAIKITIDSKQATQSVETLQADLKATKQELDRVIKTYGENSKQADKMRKSLAGLEVEMSKLGIATDEVIGSQASLKAQLRETIQELQGLEPGSARFQELSMRAAGLRETIEDTNATVKILAGNFTERLVRGITSAVQVGVAGFQAIQSSMVLLGVENEDVNKSIQKMTALLNLSQSLEMLGGLDQKIVEIAASFRSLNTSQQQTAVSAAATGVAMEGQAIGTTAAAGATTALGVAMKALPIIAVVAAIGTAVYGIYEYVTASSEATKKEEAAEKQRKQLEEQTKALEAAQKADREQVAQASVDYFNLLVQLKNTNSGSKEREKLINKINSQYGTTLQNLKDETKFQNQVNLSVKEYIALQVLKVRQERTKKEEIKAIGELVDKQNELKKFAAEYGGYVDKNGKIVTKWTEKQISDYDLANYGASVFTDTQIKLNGELEKANQKAEKYAITNNQLQTEINKLNVVFKNETGNLDKNTGSTKNATDANEKYAEVLQLAQYQLERLATFQEVLQKAESERINNTLDKEKQAINIKYGETKKQLIEKGLEEELRLEEDKFKKEGKTTEDWKLKEKEIRDRVDKEIAENRVGTFSEAELNVFNILEQYRQDDIDNLEKSYSDKEKIILNQTEQININARLAELQFRKNNELEDIENLEDTEEKKNKKRLEVRQKYADIEIDLLKQQANKEKEILDLQLQQTLADTSKTNVEKEQAQADYNSKVKNLQIKLVNDINKINDGIDDVIPTKKEKQEENLKKIQQYADKIGEIYSQLSDMIGNSIEERNKREEAAIQENADIQQKILDEQLKNKIISEEQFNYEKERLDADREVKEKEQRRKAFEANKKLQIVNAVMQGAQAALAAFASGFAVPGIGAILAPIYAGVAAAFSIAQIAQISSQQFTAASGGIVPGNGSGNVDSVPSMLAPGEFVINSKSSSMYPNLLSQINEAGGGKKLVPDALPSTTNQTTPNVFVNGNTGNNQPIKAYVVETDISESQRRINRIKQSVEF